MDVAPLLARVGELSSNDAASLRHQTSRGPPRAVNNLALQALVATFAANKSIVDESAARAAVTADRQTRRTRSGTVGPAKAANRNVKP